MFNYQHAGGSVGGSVYISVVCRGHKWASDPSDLELQGAVSHKTWFLGPLQEKQVPQITEHLFIPNQHNSERPFMFVLGERNAQTEH